MTILQEGQATRRRFTHIFSRDPNDRYVEPRWVTDRLLAAESFTGPIHDPACGSGQILAAARAAGLLATGSDIAPCIAEAKRIDFFRDAKKRSNIICNPPYGPLKEFALHALEVTLNKVALLCPLARLNAAGWMRDTPLFRIWLLTPRPSIPPHSYILRGKKPTGGRVDFCWLIWRHGYPARPTVDWLHRDGAQ